MRASIFVIVFALLGFSATGSIAPTYTASLTIVFETNTHFGRRDSYDRAGLWMGQSGRQFTVVDVIAGGPAQKAGVHQGDTILAINSVDTAHLVLPDIRQSMRERPVGSKVVLVLESQGKRRAAILTLRDLV